MKKENIKLISSILTNEEIGLTMIQISEQTQLSKYIVRTTIAYMYGAKIVSLREIGQAKLYKLTKR